MTTQTKNPIGPELDAALKEALEKDGMALLTLEHARKIQDDILRAYYRGDFFTPPFDSDFLFYLHKEIIPLHGPGHLNEEQTIIWRRVETIKEDLKNAVHASY